MDRIEVFDFILLALAVYRMALMVSKESGPFWMFKIFRRKVAAKAPKATHLDDGIYCLWCVSMQLALIAVVSHTFLHEFMAYRMFILALALSGVAVMINQKFTKG